LKDSKVFRDAVQTLLYSGSSFSNSFNTLFAPLGAEYNLGAKFPNSETTIKNIDAYQALMEELRGTVLSLLDNEIAGGSLIAFMTFTTFSNPGSRARTDRLSSHRTL
jgi:amphiphysin